MKLTELDFKKALEFATLKHSGQYRKGGLPYITHPIAVSEMLKEQGFGIDYRIAGLFHDLLEDTDATEAELQALSNMEVAEAVKLLTKQLGYVMDEYIQGIKQNEMAFAVKAADRLHNLRCSLEADENFRRKYIAETKRWYMDFSTEIPQALQAVIDSLK